MELPSLLIDMIETGRWPTSSREANSRRSWASAEFIRLLAADESEICLLPPPFFTVRELSLQNDFWNRPEADPHGINFDLAIDIGDFGPGSDAPILLDYRESKRDPRVIRLYWSRDGNTHWVHIAPNFQTFVAVLRL